MLCSTILLHRPFASQQDKKTDKPQKSPSPLKICFVAANDICDILEGYADNLPKLSCDMIFPIYISASTLSHYSKQIGREDPLTQRRVDMCVKWLQILGKSWKNAGTRQQMLAKASLPPTLGALPLKLEHPTTYPDFRNLPQDPRRTSASPLSRVLNHNVPPPPYLIEGPPQVVQEVAADDWTFLDNFGGATDEFYTMDANFRELLQGQLPLFDAGLHPQVTE